MITTRAYVILICFVLLTVALAVTIGTIYGP
jgi:hypothetical protein